MSAAFGKLPNVLIAFAAAMMLAQSVAAQTNMGTITGLVRDTSGAVVPAAAVTARNADTGWRAETRSSDTGNYVLINLPVGTYEIQVEIQGFKGWMRPGVVLSSNQSVRVDAVLQVGQVSEKVEVTAMLPALKTESGEVSTTMERRLVEQVPIAMAGLGGGMRNAFSIMMMMPETKSSNGQTAHDDFSVGGGQIFAWNVTVDGQAVEMAARNHVSQMNRLLPPLDSLEEVRIDTAAYKAEHGRAGGGQLSVVSKSGTNEYHGSGFWLYASQRFDSNTWANNKFGRAKPIYHRNEFGGSMGGPVSIPKLYNGIDKTFFFVSYQGYRFPTTSGVGLMTVPLKEMRNGDFSNFKNAAGTLFPIYDPTTTQSVSGGFSRQLFAGNVIPASRLSPIATRIAEFLPNPNLPGLAPPFYQNNYATQGNGANTRVENANSIKLDHAFGMKNRLSMTWTRSDVYHKNGYDKDPANPVHYGAGTLPYPLTTNRWQGGIRTNGNVLRINDTHIITPTIINTLTLGYHRLVYKEADITVDPPNQNWGERLGGIRNTPYFNLGFPSASIANYSGWDTSRNSTQFHNVYSVDQSISWIHKSHSFKFGVSSIRSGLNSTNWNTLGGSFAFSFLDTARPLDTSQNTGNAFASFMLGAVRSATFRTPIMSKNRFPFLAFFAQDDWKLNPRLTVNLGFRFELNQPVFSDYGVMSYWDAELPNPAANGLPGAYRFLGKGEGLEDRKTFYKPARGYGPRLGLAYQIDSNTVIRAGAGILFQPIKPFYSTAGFNSIPTFASPNQLPAFYWDDGYPDWPKPPFLNPSFNTGASVDWYGADEMSRLPTSYSYTLSVGRTLPGSLVLDVTYTANKGTYLPSDRPNYQQVPVQYAPLGSMLTRRIDHPDVVALGFRPPFPDFVKVMGNNATLGQSLKMFPQYINVNTNRMANFSGNSNYHAMILKFTKRFSDGLSLLGTYTWSKNLTDADAFEPLVAGSAGAAQDHYNRRPEKSYSYLDIPHMVKISATYDLPFGRGRRYLAHNFMRHIVGDWNLSTHIMAQSGTPLRVSDSNFNNFLGGGAARPNVISHDYRAAWQDRKFDADRDFYLTKASFVRLSTIPGAVFGNAPRYSGLARGWHNVRENIAVARDFRFQERASVTFRWEVFNLFNHKTWGSPILNLNSPLFGFITNASGNRSMQGNLRVTF